MKNKTLVMLLTIPFVVGLLSFVSIKILTNTFGADINDISWTYKENEGFKLNSKTLLEAKVIFNEDLKLMPGTGELSWSATNISESKDPVVNISKENDNYYLEALKEGEAKVTCSNKTGSKSKSFIAHIYDKGVILINREHASSGENVDPTYYVGQYDLDYEKVALDASRSKEATFKIEPTIPDSESKIYMEAGTPDLFTINGNTITCKAPGKARLKLFTKDEPKLNEEFSFEIVKGYNIYSYNDLLMATNFSTEERNIVMQVNLESLKNLYKHDKLPVFNNEYQRYKYYDELIDSNKTNTKLFGNFNFETQSMNYENEIVLRESSYNTKYIDQVNKQTGSEYSKNIKVGIDLKGDLYGNGYTINGNDLCFSNYGTFKEKGRLTPTEKDYFKGPLSYFSIGDLEDHPIVKAYGQDNALVLTNKDGITINDVKLRNSNEVDNKYNLVYSGSVLDITNKNVKVKNSVLQNGRTALRAFSAGGLVVDNSIMKNAGEFIMKLGSNEHNSYDKNKTGSVSYNDKTTTSSLGEFFNINDENSIGNLVYNDFMNLNKSSSKDLINAIEKALPNLQEVLDNYSSYYDGEKLVKKDKIYVNDCYFYNSGIFSIALETMFNGPFLYNGGSTSLVGLVNNFSSVIPKEIGGTSKPIELTLNNNKFYDYKDVDTIDATILIDENISSMIGNDVNLNSFFPMRDILKEEVEKKDYIYLKDGKKYINSILAYYGGGKNLNKAVINDSDELSEEIIVDLASDVVSSKHVPSDSFLLSTLSKCVISAIGSNPFKFVTNNKVVGIPSNFDKVPKISDLIKNFK